MKDRVLGREISAEFVVFAAWVPLSARRRDDPRNDALVHVLAVLFFIPSVSRT